MQMQPESKTKPKPPIDQREFLEDVRARQSNTLWPDTMRNGKSVDAFLWRGSPNAPLVQRIGACIFGLVFMLAGAVFIDGAYEQTDGLFGLAGTALFPLGLKFFLNGFRRRKVTKVRVDEN